MFRVDEKMGATAVDDELLLVFRRLVGGAVGEPPVLFEEDIFQNEASKICGLKNVVTTKTPPKVASGLRHLSTGPQSWRKSERIRIDSYPINPGTTLQPQLIFIDGK
jgi:hypothetical protein